MAGLYPKSRLVWQPPSAETVNKVARSVLKQAVDLQLTVNVLLVFLQDLRTSRLDREST